MKFSFSVPGKSLLELVRDIYTMPVTYYAKFANQTTLVRILFGAEQPTISSRKSIYGYIVISRRLNVRSIWLPLNYRGSFSVKKFSRCRKSPIYKALTICTFLKGLSGRAPGTYFKDCLDVQTFKLCFSFFFSI